MKKLIFCVATLLFAAQAFSQDVSLIDQVGANNDVVIYQESTEQMGISYFNHSNVIQNGDSNYADIYQIGQNKSHIEQIGDSNEAIAYQDGGDGLYGMGTPTIQESSIYQQGSRNFVFVCQWGEGNISDAIQINDLSIGGIKGNSILLEQEGRENSSTVSQIGDANWSSTMQGFYGVGGKGNLSITLQESFDENNPTDDSKYLQRTEVEQYGDKNYAKVGQYGDNQFSGIKQSAQGGPGNPWTNEAIVQQDGCHNTSTIQQSDTDLMTADANNFASVIQSNCNPNSGGNFSSIVQAGTNKATVIQVDF